MRTYLCLLALLSNSSLAHDHMHFHAHHHGGRLLDETGDIGSSHRCGTNEVADIDLHAMERAKAFVRFRSSRTRTGPAKAGVSRKVRVCFHNPSFRRKIRTILADNRALSNEELQIQLDHLNQAFTSRSCCDSSLSWCRGQCSSADMDIRFVLAKWDGNGTITGDAESTNDPDACITRMEGNQWMTMNRIGLSERRIKQQLHVGDASTLNVYFIRPGLFLGSGDSVGFGTFPWQYARQPFMDGVVVRPGTQPGGHLSPYDEGDTLVHEVGHWLGLFHTFYGGCLRSDGIADTPRQREPTKGCHPHNNTRSCLFTSGPDPIHNFMDYSDDVCMFEFTPGQAEAMMANFDAYRNPGTNIDSDLAFNLTEAGIAGPYTEPVQGMQVFRLDVPRKSTVTCETFTPQQGDDVDLFVNWDGNLDTFDCESTSNSPTEVCTVAGSGTLYAFVYSGTGATFEIACFLDDAHG